MRNRFLLFIISLELLGGYCFGQEVQYSWWDPTSASAPVIEGQAWPKELADPYDRLPARARDKVRDQVWGLSKQAAGLMIRFRSNANEIKIRYAVGGKHGFPHMPATGVSGVDLYAISSDGEWRWAAGKYAFGDTIVYNFRNLEPNDGYHKLGREYRLFLPLYNEVKWLQIGVPQGAAFNPLTVRQEKPIVVYGTSIAQGACASRPGMAWTAILGRKLDRPLINLGFSGNGRLEPELIEMIGEIDAKVYILDCLPNLTVRPDTKHTLEDVRNLILSSVKTLRQKRPQTPIVLAEHAGYTDDAINATNRKYYKDINEITRKAFAELKQDGTSNIYLIGKQEFDQDIETMVDGIHPSDLGMMRYAQGYEKNLRVILKEPDGRVSTTKPIVQLRELYNYDWEARHKAILDVARTGSPKTVVIGNSITHFWGGLPKGPRAVGQDSWGKTFGEKNVLNMAYGWDRIENVLWRVYHGELDGYNAERIVVNIGTNNLHLNTDDEILKGWDLLIEAIKNRQSKARIFMVGIYPRRSQEERVADLNEKLMILAGQKDVGFIDPGKVFLKDGKIDESMFSDGLHPNAKGYSILGEAMKPLIR
ncbi:hypothetical protein DYBT9275_03403 [Dyadobacter sp. CECT 9275]|uniref:Acetylhydrolase n=1 Tax=Dyadobacter helix TaxID=2822344 RepID=A0A916JEU3_9BACT|nr:SGNH/GDSL hydrolase family protein [Dyadobacter sp. CECT 9275]CAG5004596.1 hypothetical protein DYBT9275_03403 [Dyadobacter sp. CECT 9275]